ncbi:DUF6542 domain-containing protein [Kitasatospora sp. GP82]|uniref:DUF6542 domain-containing protein n=1 Tax=Kitasatospora sp. GP82 TaxID=3035089 RepID=UPI00247363D3|nr:DUF6542 domain-containing protein [Kitasatospora sp. GP82]MDH6123618.1 hypothetical protein [Kitasatospora sp. GP82]
MAGQRARAPYDEAELRRQRPVPPARRSGEGMARRPGAAAGPRTDETALPRPAEAGRRRPGAARVPSARRAAATARSSPSNRGRMPAALPALGLPVLGAVIDAVIGSGVGVVFAVCAVLGTALTALLSSRAGWWWVATSAPVVVLAVATGTEYLVNGDKYQGKALATGALRWVVHAFPVMAAAVSAALLVVVVRTLREGRGRRG